MGYLSLTDADRAEMLAAIGVSSIESTPILSSICSRSCSVSDRKLTRSQLYCSSRSCL